VATKNHSLSGIGLRPRSFGYGLIIATVLAAAPAVARDGASEAAQDGKRDQAIAAPTPCYEGVGSSHTLPSSPSWQVTGTLRETLQRWARRAGWPSPQFLTGADWTVDVPGSIPGSIEDAIRSLIEGFGRSPIRPRIEVSANHVILVSEAGAE
jgi:Toxin co-regulated pilus biosynthesis protein Q